MPASSGSQSTPIADLKSLREILDAVPHPIFLKDEQHRFVTLNRTMCELMGHSFEELVGRQDRDFVPKDQADVFLVTDRAVLESGAVNENEEAFTSGDGLPRTIVTRKNRLVLSDGTRLVVGCITDITAFRSAEAQIRHHAEHDHLTGLANRGLFRARLQQAVDYAAGGDASFAVMVVDLDGFKSVNDILGHAAGDNVLVEVANILSAAVGRDGIVARIGGDEFAVLHYASDQPTASAALAAAIAARISRPILAGIRPVVVSASIGIATGTGEEEAETLVRRADLALYRAKQGGRNAWRHFEAEMEASYLVNALLQDDLRAALDKDQFSLVYQPFVRVSDRTVLGFEASPRWNHPDRGAIDAGAIVPIAQATGVSGSLNEWVLRHACSAAAGWTKPLRLSVNVSGRDFAQGELPGTVREMLRRSGVDPGRLDLEVGEATIMEDAVGAERTIGALHGLGAKVVLDDFGAGMSSLQILRSLPFDKVKIDRSLMQGVGRGDAAGRVLAAVLQLTEALDLDVCAQGVDSEEQMAVAGTRCGEAQGSLLGLARPLEDYGDQASIRRLERGVAV